MWRRLWKKAQTPITDAKVVQNSFIFFLDSQCVCVYAAVKWERQRGKIFRERLWIYGVQAKGVAEVVRFIEEKERNGMDSEILEMGCESDFVWDGKN